MNYEWRNRMGIDRYFEHQEKIIREMAITRLRERLSNYAHNTWAGWMQYMFEKSELNVDGSITIPANLVERWSRQMITDYELLSEREKESDRKEADTILGICFGEDEK